MTHVEYVCRHVLLHRKPRSAAEAQSVTLADGVEPQSLVTAYLATGLQLHHVARQLAQVVAYVVVVVDLAEETDALRVLALGVHQMLALGYLTHLVLHHVADGEQRLLQLPPVQLCQEVRLVLHRVRTGAEEPPPAPLRKEGEAQTRQNSPSFRRGLGGGRGCLRIMPSGNQVILMAALLVEGPELDEPVAHHVRVRCQSSPHLLHGVGGHLVPVFAVTIHHLQPAAVLMRHAGSHLHVFLHRAVGTREVPLLKSVRSSPYLDVETVRFLPQLTQLVQCHSGIHTA